MKLTRSVVVLLAGAMVLSGCATKPHPAVCALIGGLAGAGAGMAIDNPNHAEDDNNEYLRGGLIGGGAGATIGGLTCYLMDRTPKQPPQVRASATPSRGTAPVSTEFRCVATDADGKVVKYEWDFGDGGKAEGDHGTHVYQRPGTYTATCTATDDDAMTGRATVAVTAMEKEAPPAARIVLRGVNFDFDSSKIRSDAAAILEAAAETLKENPGVSVEVGGYTDSIGTEAYNMGLSDRRASAVVDALAELGVDRSRMTPHGYGESNPVASNDTADGRAQNRRVELTQQ